MIDIDNLIFETKMKNIRVKDEKDKRKNFFKIQ